MAARAGYTGKLRGNQGDPTYRHHYAMHELAVAGEANGRGRPAGGHGATRSASKRNLISATLNNELAALRAHLVEGPGRSQRKEPPANPRQER
jgi:hypothetical protein